MRSQPSQPVELSELLADDLLSWRVGEGTVTDKRHFTTSSKSGTVDHWELTITSDRGRTFTMDLGSETREFGAVDEALRIHLFGDDRDALGDAHRRENLRL